MTLMVILYSNRDISIAQGSKAQNFTVEGTVSGVDTGTVYIYKDDNTSVPWKKMRIKKGHFSVSGKISTTNLFAISVNDDIYINGFFINTNKTIVIDYNIKTKNFIVTGSLENEIRSKFLRNIKPFQFKERLLLDSLKQFQKDSELQTKIRDQLKFNEKSIYNEGILLIKKYPNNLASVQILFDIAHYGNPTDIAKVLTTFSPKFDNHPLFKIVSKQLTQDNVSATFLATANFRDYAPTRLFNQVKGKILFVNFWASWCAPCIQEFDFLKTITSVWDSSKVAWIAISLDKDKQDWMNAVKKFNLTKYSYRIDSFKGIKEDFKISSIPYNALISPEGKILKLQVGVDELRDFLAEKRLLLKSKPEN